MKRVRAYLDRIEGDVGVLLLGEQEEQAVQFPLAYLPANIREGAVLRLHFEPDREDEEATHQAVEEVRGRLMHRGPTHDDYED